MKESIDFIKEKNGEIPEYMLYGFDESVPSLGFKPTDDSNDGYSLIVNDGSKLEAGAFFDYLERQGVTIKDGKTYLKLQYDKDNEIFWIDLNDPVELDQ